MSELTDETCPPPDKLLSNPPEEYSHWLAMRMKLMYRGAINEAGLKEDTHGVIHNEGLSFHRPVFLVTIGPESNPNLLSEHKNLNCYVNAVNSFKATDEYPNPFRKFGGSGIAESFGEIRARQAKGSENIYAETAVFYDKFNKNYKVFKDDNVTGFSITNSTAIHEITHEMALLHRQDTHWSHHHIYSLNDSTLQRPYPQMRNEESAQFTELAIAQLQGKDGLSKTISETINRHMDTHGTWWITPAIDQHMSEIKGLFSEKELSAIKRDDPQMVGHALERIRNYGDTLLSGDVYDKARLLQTTVSNKITSTRDDQLITDKSILMYGKGMVHPVIIPALASGQPIDMNALDAAQEKLRENTSKNPQAVHTANHTSDKPATVLFDEHLRSVHEMAESYNKSLKQSTPHTSAIKPK